MLCFLDAIKPGSAVLQLTLFAWARRKVKNKELGYPVSDMEIVFTALGNMETTENFVLLLLRLQAFVCISFRV